MYDSGQGKQSGRGDVGEVLGQDGGEGLGQSFNMDWGQDVGEGAGLAEGVDAVQPQYGVDYVEKVAEAELEPERSAEKETHRADGGNRAT